jgi:hypothetical protein
VSFHLGMRCSFGLMKRGCAGVLESFCRQGHCLTKRPFLQVKPGGAA